MLISRIINMIFVVKKYPVNRFLIKSKNNLHCCIWKIGYFYHHLLPGFCLYGCVISFKGKTELKKNIWKNMLNIYSSFLKVRKCDCNVEDVKLSHVYTLPIPIDVGK